MKSSLSKIGLPLTLTGGPLQIFRKNYKNLKFLAAFSTFGNFSCCHRILGFWITLFNNIFARVYDIISSYTNIYIRTFTLHVTLSSSLDHVILMVANKSNEVAPEPIQLKCAWYALHVYLLLV